MSNNILGLIIPTCEPDTTKNYIFSETSLKNLSYIKDICTLLINFQPPWSEEEIEYIIWRIKLYGLNVKYEYNTYEIKGKGLIPMTKIRNDAAELLQCDYYAICDDDMEFKGSSASVSKTSGEQYIDIIHYLINHPNCGIVMLGGTLIKKIKKNNIAPANIDDFYATGHGLIVKSINGKLTPDDSLDILGGGEEQIICGYRLINGLYPAKMPFSRTMHYENRRKGVIPGSDQYGWIDTDLLDNNAGEYIRKNYNSDYLSYSKLGSVYNLVKYEDYLKAGGVDFYSKREELTVDYSSCNEYNLLNEIIKLKKGDD